MKTIIVASAFILAATAAAVPLNGKGSDPQVPPAFLADKLPVPAMKLVAPPQSNKDDKKTKSAKNARRGLPVKPPVKLPVTPPQAPKPEGEKAPKAPRDLPVKPPAKLPVSPPKPEAPKAPRDLPVKAPVKAPVTPPQAPKPEAPKALKDPRALPVKPPAKLPVTPPQPKAPRGLVNVGVGADVLNHDNKAASNKPKTTDKSNGNHGPAIVDVAVHKRDDAPSDTDILQYALTLEHLEKAFYDGALEKFNHKAFAKAGLPPIVRDRFEQIAAHEAEHVSLLTSAIGATANAACNYTFPYHDPKSFAALSMVLEGVGVSAYLGAAQFIQSKEYLTVAGSILTTESRHASWVASTVNKVSPWSGPFDTPLDLDQVFSLASQFITGCPSTNVNLPVKAFPTLSIKNKKYGPGDEVTLQFDATSANGEPTYLVIYSGLTTYYATIENDTAKLPAGLEGTSYGLVSTSNTTVTDSNTIAGMLVFEFYNPSYTY